MELLFGSDDLPWYHMYHRSSLSPMNLFTTGDPISELSHEVLLPRSKTRPVDHVDVRVWLGREVVRCCAGELDSSPRDLFVLVALLLSIPGFVEHLVNERVLNCWVWKDL